jgi:peptidoglycan/xylan/chitin deacetylase (PgdA/CDA1 family)
LGEEAVREELRSSKARLEAVLGHAVSLFSYPAGGVTRRIRGMLSEEGYQAAVTTNYGPGRHDVLALHRIRITESGGSLFSFWLKTTGFYSLGKKRPPLV